MLFVCVCPLPYIHVNFIYFVLYGNIYAIYLFGVRACVCVIFFRIACILVLNSVAGSLQQS